ncbi:carbohydrate kinase family protein [Anaerolentibacter hominis]|uniref:carbohydrate kinase family protein n=1 Tax=Anaerolentibacter hominis TaxID=3079009 RepID=UPI0031B81779
MAEVVCIGIAVADVLIKGCRMERYNDEIYLADSVEINMGGDAFNEAVILSRLGHKTKLLCGLGRDMQGDAMTMRAQREGIDTSGIMYSSEDKTPIFVLMIDDSGERKCISAGPSRAAFFYPDVSEIKGARAVSLASLYRHPFTEPDVLLKVAAAAKAEGAYVCADIKTGDVRQKLSDLGEGLTYIDYLFPNEAEARFYSGESEPEKMADYFLGLGIGHVIIKLGARGCFGKSDAESFYVPGYAVKAVDGTGAGDNFASGFIAALLEGKDFRGCCEFASAVAAVSVQYMGATTGVTDRNKVEAFLETQNR